MSSIQALHVLIMLYIYKCTRTLLFISLYFWLCRKQCVTTEYWTRRCVYEYFKFLRFTRRRKGEFCISLTLVCRITNTSDNSMFSPSLHRHTVFNQHSMSIIESEKTCELKTLNVAHVVGVRTQNKHIISNSYLEAIREREAVVQTAQNIFSLWLSNYYY